MTEWKKNGNYIKRLRDLNAWTQEDLALKSGVSVSTIQRAERGENISQDVIICLADVFGVSVQDIKGMDDQPYLPLQRLSTGRQLFEIVRPADRIDFDFAEIEDIDQAAQIESLHEFCQMRCKLVEQETPLAQVRLELEARDLLSSLALQRLTVSGGRYMLQCYEIDDDGGTDIPVLMGQWTEQCCVIRVGTVPIERAYVMEKLGPYETPCDGVVFPAAATSKNELS